MTKVKCCLKQCDNEALKGVSAYCEKHYLAKNGKAKLEKTMTKSGECEVSKFSSRTCELGTKSCQTDHKKPMTRVKGGNCPTCGADKGWGEDMRIQDDPEFIRGMNTERNKFLTEAMGECWHDMVYNQFGDRYSKLYRCTKCSHQDNSITLDNDFSTWEGFGKLWEWSQKQEWWTEFVRKYGKLMCDCGCNDGYMALHFITPTGTYNFPDTIYEYLKERGI